MIKKLFATTTLAAFLLASTALPSLAHSQQSDFATGTQVSETSGFSGVPGVADGGPDLQRSRFTYQMDAGQRVTDFFYVSNVGTVPLDLIVYGADGTTTNDGSYDVADSTSPATDVGSWVRWAGGASQVRIKLGPGANASLPFTLQTPSNASPGDHAGGIAVATAPQGDGQIRIQRRVVTRLYARIRGNLTPNLTISNMQASYTPAFNPLDGRVTEHFTITNNGNISLKAVAFADVSGIFGLPLANQVVAPVSEILPGTSRDYSISVEGVGQWIFLNPRVKLAPDVDKDALNPGALTTISRDATLWEFPTTWFILILILGIGYFSVRMRVVKRRRQVAQWLEYTEAEARRKANSN